MTWLGRGCCAVALIVLGAWLQSLRAQTSGTFDGHFRHIGFVVEDADGAAAKFGEAFGVTPPAVRRIDEIPMPRAARGDSQLFVRTTEIRTNGVELHVLEPGGGSSPWRDHLERVGDSTVQHISFGVTDLPRAVAALERLGGTVTAGAADSFFAYVDMPQLPFAIELERVP